MQRPAGVAPAGLFRAVILPQITRITQMDTVLTTDITDNTTDIIKKMIAWNVVPGISVICGK